LQATSPKPITQEQAAALVGVTHRHLARICVGPDAPPKLANAVGRAHGFPVGPFGQWLRARIKAELGIGADGEAIDPQREKALLDRERRRQIEMANAATEGRLVDAGEVAQRWATVGNMLRQRLLAIPTRLAAQVAGMDDERAIRDAIKAEIYSALTELSANVETTD
jgi:phage terminase Nu1 subunit (DNA packaging protein)